MAGQAERSVMDRAAQRYRLFETAMGFCGIAWAGAAITSFRLPTASAGAAARLILRRIPNGRPGEPPAQVLEAMASAKRYFEGGKEDFTGYGVDLGEENVFFREVYALVREIPWGATTTYGALAKALGAGPETARDVGQAMAQNPVPLIVPCHRVLAAGGKIGGFSAPGGSTTKARMLELEGVILRPPAPAQQNFGF
jgi:methylated-DNA-[protein]-cysteine S-methyltransferase